MGRSPGGPQDRRPTTRGGRHEAVSFRPRARSVFLSFFLSFHVSFFHHRDTGDTVHAPRAPRHTRLTAMSATATNVPPNMCSCILTTCRPKGSASREAARSDADRTCLPVLAHGKASAAEGQHHLPSHSLATLDDESDRRRPTFEYHGRRWPWVEPCHGRLSLL